MPAASTPFSLHPANSRYFHFHGRPYVLITATEHYGAVINRNFDYITYLDDMIEKRMTLSRCFLLFRELQVYMPPDHLVPVNPHSPCKPLAGEYLSPYLRTGPGFATDGFPKFDLDQWNSEYFERLRDFLTAAQGRGIVIELTLFSCTYSDAVWRLNPLHIQNNVNGVGDIPWQNYISQRDEELFARQLSFVRKVVQEVNEFDNFYFEVCNEPLTGRAGFEPLDDFASTTEIDEWQRAIRAEIRAEEATLDKQHLIFQVPVEGWRTDTPLELILNEPDVDAINIHDYQNLTYRGEMMPSLSRFMQRDLRLNRIRHLWTSVHDTGKPFVFDEDNAATNALDEQAWIVHRKRAWTTLCSGGHYNMIDFSIQVGGQEAGTPASQAMIRSWLMHLSTFIHDIDFIHMTPDLSCVTSAPANTIAVVLNNPGVETVIYLADQREVDDPTLGEPCQGELVCQVPDGEFEVRIFSPASGQYEGSQVYSSTGQLRLSVEPFVHDIVLHSRRL